MSDWNRFFDKKLSLKLTVEESRLADALARNLLGFRTLEDRIGERWLMKQAGFRDRRSLVKARDGLVAKALLYFEAGTPGRGHGGFYRLLLDEETRGADRAFSSETASAARAAQIAPEMRGEMRGVGRARIQQRKPSSSMDVSGDTEFDAFVEEVGPLWPGQRDLCWRAYTADRDGFARCVKRALENGDAPAALLCSMLKKNAHLAKASGASKSTRSPKQKIDAWLAESGAARQLGLDEALAVADGFDPEVREYARAGVYAFYGMSPPQAEPDHSSNDKQQRVRGVIESSMQERDT